MSDYDAWVLRGPEEHLFVITEACETCKGTGKVMDEIDLWQVCDDCDGDGEITVTLDEPDGDYLYEQARDRKMETGE